MPEVRYLIAREIGRERSARLLRYLLEHGANELTITVKALQDTLAPFADAFEDEMAPFERLMAPRPVLATPTATERVRPVRLWALSGESLARLLTFLDDGLIHSPPGPDGWLEDLAIFRDGQLVLAVLSHERVGVLRLSPQEHRDIAALGIPTEATA